MTKTLTAMAGLALVTIAAGCGVAMQASSGAAIEYGSYEQGPEGQPVPAQSVQVFRAGQQLPDGFSLIPGQHKRLVERINLEPDYPTAAEPHQIIGALAVRPDRENIDAAEARVVAEAGRHGANAIIVFDRDYRLLSALALRLSAAQAVQPSAQELLAAAEIPEGYTPSGEPQPSSLEGFQPLSLQATRGTCYAITFALDANAAFSDHARRAIRYSFSSPDDDIQTSAGSIATSVPATMRSHTRVIGCPQVDGPLTIDLQAFSGAANDDSQLHNLGSGPLYFQLYTRSITDAELAERAERSRQRWEEARRRSQEQTQRECAECAGALVACGNVNPADCPGYRSCLQRRYVRVEECH